MNYAPRPYYQTSLSRKRQIINQQLDELHNLQLDMIDRAVTQSDLRDANELIEYIKSL